MAQLVIIITLIFLNGVFSMSEIAVVSARKAKLSKEAKNGDKRADIAIKMAESPNRFLSTVQIGITLISILTGILSGDTISSVLTQWLMGVGMPETYAPSIAKVIIVVMVTYLTIVFGELLPKRIGIAKAETIAKMVSRPMNNLSHIMSPFVLLLSGSTSLLFKLLKMKDKDAKVTEDEIKSMVQESADDGVVQPVEQDLVERVFLLGDLNVDTIMTPRNEMVWLDVNMTHDQIESFINENMLDYYPVADGNLDHLLGVTTLKQLVLHLNKPDFKLSDYVVEPLFLYENTKVYRAIEHMRESNTSRGLIVDEFGSCIGIITWTDIVETLFGYLPDDDEDPQIVARENGDGWLVDGSCTMVDFLTFFDSEDSMIDEDFTTVAGLCIHQLRHIPKRGEMFEWKNFSFEIVDVDMAKIDTLLVKLKKPVVAPRRLS